MKGVKAEKLKVYGDGKYFIISNKPLPFQDIWSISVR